MARQIINVGTVPDDGTGDPLRDAFVKTNSNFTELYDHSMVAGKINAWPDPFFRFLPPGALAAGRDRYWGSAAAVSLVPGTIFDGNALLRNVQGISGIGGPVIYLDELGAAPGDLITLRVLVTGNGAAASCACRPRNGNTLIDTQKQFLTDGGSASSVTSAEPLRMTATFVIPAGTTNIALYPYSNSAAPQINVEAFWGYKGNAATGPAWPTFSDDEYQNLKLSAVEEIAGPVAYGFDTFQSVAADSETITLEGANPSLSSTTSLKQLPFMGWAELCAPAGIAFNAIRVEMTDRLGESGRWKTIHAVVRTGSSPHLASAPVVAVGSIEINDTLDMQTGVEIILRDPVSGAVVTLTNAAFSGGKYLLAAYALTASGAPAAFGPPLATLSNSLGESYYHSSTNPVSGSWSKSVAHIGIGFTHLLLNNPREIPVYAPSEALTVDLGTEAAPHIDYANLGRLRKFRAKASLRMMVPAQSARIVMAMGGDSWSTLSEYMIGPLTKRLKALLGDGGVGWFGMGFTGAAANTVAGDAEGLYYATRAGTWTSNYHAGSTSPNISDARSSAAGSIYQIRNNAGASRPPLSDVKLHFTGTADGVIRWRWNGGAWSSNTNVQGTAGTQQFLSLTAFPTGTLVSAAANTDNLEIEVVSGSVILCGVDFQSAGDGIVVHKLGSSGSKASDWQASMSSGVWQDGYAQLGPVDLHTHLLGVNDDAATVPPAIFATQMGTIADNILGAIDGVGLMLLTPPRMPTRAGADYASAVRTIAMGKQAAFVDLQAVFGVTPVEYADGSAVPMVRADNSHPTAEWGTPALVAEIERSLLWR
ncbi:SGNH/GDSL hydrolase family protein [Caenibius sp. WL]|uniref:SGNH/GDSL hydrolase family protein n=1 Tax=Caenibius sp. WL TaxID=2872646 RepID=UPI001C99EC75|nr:SGNH/GDSL hydrolase family protein [Caenibius sp. WL]QZP06777.1 hypothetical protein K5X80_08555 [Caenibius sp. WL]